MPLFQYRLVSIWSLWGVAAMPVMVLSRLLGLRELIPRSVTAPPALGEGMVRHGIPLGQMGVTEGPVVARQQMRVALEGFPFPGKAKTVGIHQTIMGLVVVARVARARMLAVTGQADLPQESARHLR